ncbi:hypothetical protein ACQ4LE_007694 [Meloidogyne hapla]
MYWPAKCKRTCWTERSILPQTKTTSGRRCRRCSSLFYIVDLSALARWRACYAPVWTVGSFALARWRASSCSSMDSGIVCPG